MYNIKDYADTSNLVENLIDFSKEGKNFVISLLIPNSKYRMELKDFLKHTWF